MVILTVDGKAILPRGNPTVEPYGVKIEGVKSNTIIPFSQIRLIYNGQDYQDDFTFYTKSMGGRRKPKFDLNKSADALMEDLYKWA